MRHHWLALCFLLLCTGCAGQLPDHFGAKPVSYEQLHSWEYDAHANALEAFLLTCKSLKNGTAAQGSNLSVSAADWQALCAHAQRVPADDNMAARAFFEAHFTPYRVNNNGKEEGLFTGYYEPLLHGAKTRGGRYQYPVYGLPKDMKSGVSYHSHSQINAGALKGKGLELMWVDDPVMLFFLQIQGSGRVQMDDGRMLRLGYAGKNGHPYVAIGKFMKEEKMLPEDGVSFFSIRDWLYAHPQEAQAVMERNPSYVFFQILTKDGPIGAANSALTPMRSLAVDKQYIPYGLPLYLETELPVTEATVYPLPLAQLLIAQDTGGAIRGPVRGDIFFGYGPQAEQYAGNMKGRGIYTLLVPKSVAPAWQIPEI